MPTTRRSQAHAILPRNDHLAATPCATRSPTTFQPHHHDRTAKLTGGLPALRDTVSRRCRRPFHAQRTCHQGTGSRRQTARETPRTRRRVALQRRAPGHPHRQRHTEDERRRAHVAHHGRLRQQTGAAQPHVRGRPDGVQRHRRSQGHHTESSQRARQSPLAGVRQPRFDEVRLVGRYLRLYASDPARPRT